MVESKQISQIDRDFLKSVLSLAAKKEIVRLLYVYNTPLEEDDLKGRSIKRKLLYAVTQENLLEDLREKGFSAVLIPPYDYARVERIKIAVVSGLASGQLEEGQTILAATGRSRGIDTLLKFQLGSGFDDRISVDALNLSEEFHGQVVESLLRLALRIGHDGFEGHPVGSLIVVGDSIGVMEKSKQLTINPFQGISESERNVLDPRIREAIRNFSVLDGAFVVREDGVVMAAGRYLQSPTDNLDIPLGLGARHASAAAITKETGAVAITVSQTSGSVRVFRDGHIALELHQPARRM